MTFLLFAAYLVATVAIGLWAARRSRGTQEDYFLGGRDVSAFAMALSAVSSGRSAWLVVGASGAAWSAGLSAIWLFPGYVAAEALMFLTLGPRLRRRSEDVGAITLPEVLERLALGPDGKPGSSRLPVRSVAAVLIVLFLTTYVGAQLLGGGKTLGATFELEGRLPGLLITAVIVLVYTLLGGYRAVVVTDVIQALLMLVGIVLLPVLAIASVGGLGALMSSLESIDPALVRWTSGWAAVVGGLAIGLGSLGNPHILVRHMSLRDPSEARSAALTGTLWNIVMAGGAFAMGLVGRALYPTLESFAQPDAEYLYATLGADISVQYLFAGFAGFLLAALFAAVMSTCDSQLLVVASSLVRDFRKRDKGEGGLGGSRVAVLATLAVAVVVTELAGDNQFVHGLVLLSWGALGAAFGPPLLMVLYDRRTTAAGVLGGILTGAVVTAVWSQVPALDSAMYELVPGFAASLLVVFALRRRG